MIPLQRSAFESHVGIPGGLRVYVAKNDLPDLCRKFKLVITQPFQISGL
jgi:hypothetical protein